MHTFGDVMIQKKPGVIPGFLVEVLSFFKNRHHLFETFDQKNTKMVLRY